MSKSRKTFRPQVRIFVSYAHADPTIFKSTLESFLKWPCRNVVVNCWSDKDIVPGSDPDKRIREELKVMDIFVALISPMFAASRYIQEVEVVEAKRRCKRGEIVVAPIIVTHPGENECSWLLGYGSSLTRIKLANRGTPFLVKSR